MSFIEESKHLRIPFQEIQLATKNCTTVIGRGGYGVVYKGELSLTGIPNIVAVKRLDSNISGQGFKEFLTEIQLLSRYKHPNLISLLGFCDEGSEKVLIYEYAENGSLDMYLRSDINVSPLTWKQRLNICVDAARGLDYLHNHVAENQRVIHRDIKSANILIDGNWKAMIADLGLSKIGRANENDSYLITNASGTHGYCDPSYINTGILTKESDVYSFGVVLFEVLCGRLCFMNVNNQHRFLPQLAQRYYKEKRLHEIIDPYLKNHVDSYSMKDFSEIAYQCLEDDRKRRPSIGFVLQKLEKALDLLVAEEREALELQAWERRKLKTMSLLDAAMVIQMTYRVHLIKRSQAVCALRALAVARGTLTEHMTSFNNISYRHRLAHDAEEKHKFSERILLLLLTVDAIEGADIMVRAAKRSVVDDLEAMMDVVDPQPGGDQSLSLKRRTFNMPDGIFQKELAEGVPQVVHMLGQVKLDASETSETCFLALERKKWREELSPQDAAMVIQMNFRTHLIKRSQALRAFRELAIAKGKLKKITTFFNDFSYRQRVARDAEEKQRFSERIIMLLIAVDAIEGAGIMVRNLKSSTTDELEAMLNVVDPKAGGGKFLSLKKRTLDMQDGVISKELLLGVVQLGRMLETFGACLASERRKGKELLHDDAAMVIQMSFRKYMKKKSSVVSAFRELAIAKGKLRDLLTLFNSNFSYRRRVARDAEEKLKFVETITVLLISVDAIEGAGILVRLFKNSMMDEIEGMLNVVDPQLGGGKSQPLLRSLRRTFYMPDSVISKELLLGVLQLGRTLQSFRANCLQPGVERLKVLKGLTQI